MKLLHIYLALVFLLCSTHSSAQDVAKEEDSLQKVIRQNNFNNKDKLKALTRLADFYVTRNFNQSIVFAEKGYQLSVSQKDYRSAGECLKIKGVANYFKGNYDTAAFYYYKALNYMNIAPGKDGRALVLNELGKLYRKTKDLNRALLNYDEAFKIYSELKDSTGMSTILNESGVVLEYLNLYDDAINRYNKALKICELKNDSTCISYSLGFIGGVYMLQKKFQESENYLHASLRIRNKLKDTFALALSYSDLGALHIAMKNFAKAKEDFLFCNELISRMNYKELQSQNLKALATIEEKLNNPGKALDYYRLYSSLKDSLFNEAKMKQIEELDAKYQSEKKEQQLKVQQLQIEKKNTLLWSSLILFVLLITILYILYRKRQEKNKAAMQLAVMQEQEKATRAIIEAEEKERQRIAADLHDGIGQMMSVAKMNLSAFESEISFTTNNQKKQFENAIALVDESCKEVRSVSHRMMPDVLLKAGLSNALQDFTGRIDNNKISIHLHTEGLQERMSINTEAVVYRIIQECVNNVLKHAEASLLDIAVLKDYDGLSITIEDNGRGFDVNGTAEGIGLKNIITRVKYLKGTIDIHSAPGKGTLTAIHIPVTA